MAEVPVETRDVRGPGEPTDADLATARWPIADSPDVDWLRELTDDDGLTGFMPPPLPDAAWVLHPLYAHELGPFDMTYTEYHRAVLMGGGPEIVPGLDPAEVVGRDPGERPGPRWHRVRWQELARRSGDPVVPEGSPPYLTSFPPTGQRHWPVGVTSPREGSMDRTSWNRLAEILSAHSVTGPAARCLAYYNPLLLAAEDFDNLHVRAGALADAKVLYEHPEEDGWSPSNFWAEDRSWVVCTDYDLMATKVAGPAALIEALLADEEIEAVRLPWPPDAASASA
ncbi:hypothetical protein ACFWAR_11160 [Streptomyces sp. NPDC059917]|uniref:hypothetical protein n=1 Tax=Streptomyces sp. NPDC059917 TaxID=3347002 RepID=UPI003651D79F